MEALIEIDLKYNTADFCMAGKVERFRLYGSMRIIKTTYLRHTCMAKVILDALRPASGVLAEHGPEEVMPAILNLDPIYLVCNSTSSGHPRRPRSALNVVALPECNFALKHAFSCRI